MRVLLIFMDGIGLGEDNTATNPFSIADLPTLHQLTNNSRWLKTTGKQQTTESLFIPTDPRLGVDGRPQSATGQATIFSGVNVPSKIGRHYGPKPNEDIRSILDDKNIFKTLAKHNKSFALLEAYPPEWHASVARGKRLLASYQYALDSAGGKLMTQADLIAGNAISGDWTGQAWHDHMKINDIPILEPYTVGETLAQLSRNYDFTVMSHWITDVVGHRGTMQDAVTLLQTFDEVMRGVLDHWRNDEGVIIITSDHGNIEAIGDRKHTENDVPTLIIGQNLEIFTDKVTTLADIVPLLESILLT